MRGSGNQLNEITDEEHAYINGVGVKKVVIIDGDGNLANLEVLIGTLQELVQRLSPLGGAITSGGGSLRVAGAGGTMPVTGTFYQTTQPVSEALIGSHPSDVVAKAQSNLLAVIGNVNNCVGA